MKTIEDIEREYKDFVPVSTFIKTLEDLYTFLDLGICDTYDIQRDLKKELKENYKVLLSIEVWNFLFFMFGEEGKEFYEDDNKIVRQLQNLAETYRKYCKRIREVSSEQTLDECVKLIDFLTKYYNEHIDYFEDRRDSLELAYRGISMFNPAHTDNREVIDMFFDKKMKEISNKEEKKGSEGKIYVKKVGKNENVRRTVQRI